MVKKIVGFTHFVMYDAYKWKHLQKRFIKLRSIYVVRFVDK
jgi:hypothetical protein